MWKDFNVEEIREYYFTKKHADTKKYKPIPKTSQFHYSNLGLPEEDIYKV
jgi:hypothetical protein